MGTGVRFWKNYRVRSEMLLPVLERSLRDPGEALGPIVSAASNQPDAINFTRYAQATALVFDLVKSFWSGRNVGAGARKAKLKGLIISAR